MAEQTAGMARVETILGSMQTPHSFQWTTPAREQDSHSQEAADGDPHKTSPQPPGRPEMSSVSFYLSLVARNLQ